MHPLHILPFAALPAMGAFLQARGQGLDLPHLRALLGQMQPARWLHIEDNNALAPHEHLWLQAAWPEHPTTTNPSALAALRALQAGHRLSEEQGWAQITPCHLHISTDSIVAADPARLQLAPEHLQALRESLQALWAEDGLQWFDLPADSNPHQPAGWLVCADWLRGLALPSIERVAGQDVRLWAPALERTHRLQRLQTEAQMLLYEHPINHARTATGLLPINALWFSGAGITPADTASASARLPHIHLHTELRASALQGDYPAWAQQWQALDTQLLARLLALLQQGQPLTLALTGEHRAVVLEPARPGLVSKIAHWWRQRRGDAALDLLEKLSVEGEVER